MTSENQNASEGLRDAMLAKLQSASSVSELRDLLRAIDEARDAIGLDASAELARMVFAAISKITLDSPGIATEVIGEHLLPWCMLRTGQRAEQSNLGHEVFQLRQLLKAWVYQYPQRQMMEVRTATLHHVQQHLDANPTKEAFWVISAIGYRTPRIVDVIWRLLKQEDELSDTVLGTLVSLGAAPHDRDRLLDCVHDGLSAGLLTRGGRLAVQELAGPHRSELAVDLLNLAIAKYPREDHIDFSLAISAATRAVERCADNGTVQDEAWSILRDHFKTVRQTSDYARRCNTKSTVIDYVRWLLTEEWASDADSGAYIVLSRLGDLTKPQQLAGWDEVNSAELTAMLERLAKNDTRIKGRFATTSSRLKTEAWETALTIGCPLVEDWIDVALMDETNPYVVHDVADVVSCLRLERLPQRLLDAIVAEPTTDDDNGRLFRQTALMNVARSSGSRAAFEAMLRFGFTHEGHVLFSTIDAIVDIAVARIQEGDSDIVDRLLEMTAAEHEKRHREAAVSAFCRLCSCGRVRGELLNRLWQFANATDLEDYWRCQALEVIGLADFEGESVWSGSIRRIAMADGSDFGWRACEVLIRRNWVTVDDEGQLFARLGLVMADGAIKAGDPGGIDGWQAFLIGLLFRRDKERFAKAVSEVLVHGSSDSVHQLLDCLRQHGVGCPEPVSLALIRRIRDSNDNANTDTELFDVLAMISPSKLLSLSEVCTWTDSLVEVRTTWLVEARTAMCEAIRTIAAEHAEYRDTAVDCLVAFTRDASFQVRRSAYRAIALWGGNHLESICTAWSQSTDLELRKRAAEAVAWLSIAEYTDAAVCGFGLGWDPEPSVREIWTGVLSARRERRWAAEYVDSILEAAAGDAPDVLRVYRFGRALSKIGDDESANRIEAFLASRPLSPSVRHWLTKVTGEIKKNWKKLTDKWPEPWSHEQGTVEELDGVIELENGTRLNARLSLWCRYRSGPSDLGEWGGVAEDIEGTFPFASGAEQIEVRIPGRSPARATVFGSHWSSASIHRLVLGGASPYPTRPHAEQDPHAQLRNLVDTVVEIIRETGATVIAEDVEVTSQRLQILLKRAEMSLLSMPPEYDSRLRMKLACQEAALVTRTLAESLPPTFLSSVALWRIANAILEGEALLLRLSPAELNTFGATARLGDRDSHDDLLFWMMDRVASQQFDDVIGNRRRQQPIDAKPHASK